jgi:hypothetical protein
MQVNIYASGKSGWVENKQGLSIHFIVYNNEIGRIKDLILGWDNKPTKRMISFAKRAINVHNKERIKTDLLYNFK